jgi:hypothetical protein
MKFPVGAYYLPSSSEFYQRLEHHANCKIEQYRSGSGGFNRLI